MHFNLSTVGSLELLLIVLLALRWGFGQAFLASLLALAALNFLFTPPIFHFSVAEPENWISLLAFEATALLVSALSSKVRGNAAQSEIQRSQLAKLYELSRAVLLVDRQESTSAYLANLIREIIGVDDVDIWHVYASTDDATRTKHIASAPLAAWRSGRDADDAAARTSQRILRVGTTSIGAMVMRGWQVAPALADAVASLTALALERARSLDKESRAEAGRQTEQLRTAVLDGLAHAFKTPLTAILTASSGLLEVGELTAMQAELISLVDQEATKLNQLTTRLLQTASLEAREVKLRRESFALADVLDEILRTELETVRSRVRVCVPEGGVTVSGDPQMVHFALAQLIDNAAKYSSVGSAIDVTLRREETEVVIIVENSGSTVRREERDRIFERFYRGSDAATGPAGTGLGLSIVRKAAEAHNGRAWVESDADRTRFYFTLQQTAGETHG
jgi:two-component system sensor histidine kinase KdpD